MVANPVLPSECPDTADRSAQVGALPTVPGMRSALQFAGVVLVAVGVSGTIDRLLGFQPILGFLNVVNRFLVPNVDALAGYELYANLSVAVSGIVVVFAASGLSRSAS